MKEKQIIKDKIDCYNAGILIGIEIAQKEASYKSFYKLSFLRYKFLKKFKQGKLIDLNSLKQ